MTLWRRVLGDDRRQPEPPAPPAPPAAGPEQRPGDLPCAATGCAETTGAGCAYIDRRGRACPTAWCPAHREVAAGRVYCRRHAGVVRALAAGAGTRLPDLETRAPGLVEWLARDLGDDLGHLLMATGAGDAVTSEAAQLVDSGRAREQIWERSWRLCRHTGFVHRVALQVEEGNDTDVVVRVGRREVARLTPPWIEARRRGERLSPEEDASRRAAFREAILGAVRRGLAEGAVDRA
ncbi:MAG TPA: hypothetical protein VGP96_11555 [Candidatus Dormibacteraeota bacterium]|jgi:hypothetical protein|nr:hypothetical protein [Candidatus Dormibacteraeota bacterium]